jgi:hypothetical protein
MGSTLFGGPQLTNIPPPNPLFPGVSQTYTGALQSAGIPQTSFGTLAQTAQTGLPTNVGPAFDALKQSMKTNIAEGARDLKEKFGALGDVGGSDVEKAGADYEAQSTANLNNILAQYTMQASEAAAGRQVQAATTAAQLASEPALAFAPSAVVSQQPGMLGGLATLALALAA